MSRKKKILIAVEACLLGATLAFIWFNSLLSEEASGAESQGLFDVLKPIFDFIFGEGLITHEVFRKLAHFGEFAVLGVEISLLYFTVYDVKKSKIAEFVSAGLFVAVIDESLQILSSRGSAVLDVLIDYSGYLTGTAVFWAVAIVIKNLIKHKADKTQIK